MQWIKVHMVLLLLESKEGSALNEEISFIYAVSFKRQEYLWLCMAERTVQWGIKNLQ